MRLIDADTLTERLTVPDIQITGLGLETVIAVRDVTEIIKTAPTVKPQQGRWIDMGDFEQCSVCTGTHLKEFKSYYGKATWAKTPYCPFCGAKMEGETDEERND